MVKIIRSDKKGKTGVVTNVEKAYPSIGIPERYDIQLNECDESILLNSHFIEKVCC